MADRTQGKSPEHKSSEHGKGMTSHSSSHNTSSATGRMDALSLLKQDHQMVKQLFEQIEEGSEQEQTWEIFNQIKRALEIHSAIEEEMFYPAVRKAKSEHVQEEVSEACDAHQQIEMLLEEIAQSHGNGEEMEADGEDIGAGATLETRLEALKEEVLQHVSDEESEIFRDARKYLGDQLESLGAKLQQRKEQLEAGRHQADGHTVRRKNASHSQESPSHGSETSHSGKHT